MLNWDQLDELHKIANNTAESATRRISDIQDKMAEWYGAVYSMPTMPAWMHSYPDDDIQVIDPSTEAVKAKMSIPGQTGRSVYVGLYG